MALIELKPRAYGTHSLRRTKVALVYKKTGNLRACQSLLGHSRLESTVRYLGMKLTTPGLVRADRPLTTTRRPGAAAPDRVRREAEWLVSDCAVTQADAPAAAGIGQLWKSGFPGGSRRCQSFV